LYLKIVAEDGRERNIVFFFSSRRRHTRFSRDWSSDVCSSDLSPLCYRRILNGNWTWRIVPYGEHSGLLPPQEGACGRVDIDLERSEERRVGKECRCRWRP